MCILKNDLLVSIVFANFVTGELWLVSWVILVSCRGFFERLCFGMVKYLDFHNSSFSLRYFKNLKWQGISVTHLFTLALIQIQFFHSFGRVGFVCASIGRCVCVCVFGFVVLARGREGGSHGGVGDGNEWSVGVVPIPFASAACAHADGNIWDLVGRRRRHGTVRQSAHGEAFRRQRQLYYNHCMCAQSLCLCVCLSPSVCLPSAVEIWTTTTNRSTSCSELNSGF
jgi:hypothetical protein